RPRTAPCGCQPHGTTSSSSQPRPTRSSATCGGKPAPNPGTDGPAATLPGSTLSPTPSRTPTVCNGSETIARRRSGSTSCRQRSDDPRNVGDGGCGSEVPTRMLLPRGGRRYVAPPSDPAAGGSVPTLAITGSGPTCRRRQRARVRRVHEAAVAPYPHSRLDIQPQRFTRPQLHLG